MSAFGGKADIDWTCSDVRFWPILLQKSAMTGRSGGAKLLNRLLLHSLIRDLTLLPPNAALLMQSTLR
jgi:hypothetical protein